jgi:hypothetical protein
MMAVQMPIADWTSATEPFVRPLRTGRLTLRCAFCAKHFTADKDDRIPASIRHIESCAKAQRRIDHWYPDAERKTRALPGIANTYVSGREITGTFKSGVKCDARCQGAIGHDCECSCNGRNHGIGLSA